jgi:hypothetical protein
MNDMLAFGKVKPLFEAAFERGHASRMDFSNIRPAYLAIHGYYVFAGTQTYSGGRIVRAKEPPLALHGPPANFVCCGSFNHVAKYAVYGHFDVSFTSLITHAQACAQI